MTRIMTLGLALLVLGVADAVQAQKIDCSGGCTETKYGLGPPVEDLFFREDQVRFQYNSSQFAGSISVGSPDPNVPITSIRCNKESTIVPIYGQVILREQDSCSMDSVPDGVGCLVEIPIPTDPNDSAQRSGFNSLTVVALDFVGIFLSIRTATFTHFEGSVGERVLIGGGPATKIVWDELGPEDPDSLGFDPSEGVLCCQSSSGTLCTIIPAPEYPLIDFVVSTHPVRRASPHWIFDAGAGTNWRLDPNHTVPFQEQGLCAISQLSCTIENPTVAPSIPCSEGDVCDFRDGGLRPAPVDLLSDGSPNPTVCARSPYILRGFPNQDCWLVERYANDGDPLPGCLLSNFGSHPRPDLDCDGVVDVIPDKCLGHAERDPFLDTNADGIGDECQCGDTNTMFDQDGTLTFGDALNIVQTVQGTGSADFRLADTDGNNLLTFGDAFNVVQGVQLVQDPTTFTCGRNP